MLVLCKHQAFNVVGLFSLHFRNKETKARKISGPPPPPPILLSEISEELSIWSSDKTQSKLITP